MITFTYKLQGNGTHSWTKDGEDTLKELVLNISVLSCTLKAVLNSGGMLNSVQTAINLLPSEQRELAQFAWDGSPTISIDSPTVALIMTALDLTILETTAIFQEAYNLKI